MSKNKNPQVLTLESLMDKTDDDLVELEVEEFIEFLKRNQKILGDDYVEALSSSLLDGRTTPIEWIMEEKRKEKEVEEELIKEQKAFDKIEDLSLGSSAIKLAKLNNETEFTSKEVNGLSLKYKNKSKIMDLLRIGIDVMDINDMSVNEFDEIIPDLLNSVVILKNSDPTKCNESKNIMKAIKLLQQKVTVGEIRKIDQKFFSSSDIEGIMKKVAEDRSLKEQEDKRSEEAAKRVCDLSELSHMFSSSSIQPSRKRPVRASSSSTMDNEDPSTSTAIKGMSAPSQLNETDIKRNR